MRVFRSAHEQDQSVLLAFDKDEAGLKMSREVEALCQEASVKYSVRFPTLGKDWNEELDLPPRDSA